MYSTFITTVTQTKYHKQNRQPPLTNKATFNHLKPKQENKMLMFNKIKMLKQEN